MANGASSQATQTVFGGVKKAVALYHFSAKVLSRSGRNTVRAMAYRAGCKLYDEKTGETFNYGHKAVKHVELLLPKDAPEWAVEIQKLIAEDRRKGVQAFVDKVEGRPRAVVEGNM